jgi:hypothetical protein
VGFPRWAPTSYSERLDQASLIEVKEDSSFSAVEKERVVFPVATSALRPNTGIRHINGTEITYLMAKRKQKHYAVLTYIVCSVSLGVCKFSSSKLLSSSLFLF